MNGDEGIVPQHIVITTEFQFVDTFSIDKARFIYEDSLPVCALQLFTGKTGPHRHRLDPQRRMFAAIATRAIAEINSTRAASSIADSPCVVVLDSRVKRLRETNLAKARTANENKPKIRRALEYKNGA